MKMQSLGTVCEFRYGKSLPEARRREGNYRVFGSNGSVGYHDEPLTNAPTIIVGRKGSIGEINFSEQPCWPIDTTYYIDQSATKHNIRWLFYALKSLRLTELNKATGVPGLNRNDAYERMLIVPNLRDQARIAAILDKADAIRRKREQALALADDFLRSAYLHVVGLKHPDFLCWQPATIESLAANKRGSIRSGPFGSALLHSEFVDEGVAVLGIDNAVKNKFQWAERRFITREKYEELRRYRVYPSDVIITIMGTTGRSAVVPDDIPEAITTKHLASITCDLDKVLPEFLSFAIHSDPVVIDQIRAANKGAIMDGLNLGIIRQIKIRRPPMSQQRLFAELLNKNDAAIRRMTTPTGDGSDLFASLSQRAFRGEI
ncbi:MAG: restriction endonuclease subunit S [Roseiarcus sp.]|jgi:type I restriction enzyme S subunit